MMIVQTNCMRTVNIWRTRSGHGQDAANAVVDAIAQFDAFLVQMDHIYQMERVREICLLESPDHCC